MRTLKSILLISLALLLLPTVALAKKESPRVYIDSTLLHFDEQPFIVGDTTLVPFRPIFEALGYKVTWDQQTKTVIGRKKGFVLELSIDSTTAYVNDQTSVLKVAPRIVNGQTFVPLRFISEESRAEVTWIAADNTIEINSSELYYALKRQDTNLLAQLLSDGTDPNKKELNRTTPLNFALLIRDIDSVRLLLEYGADMTIRDDSGLDANDIVSLHYSSKTDKLYNYNETKIRELINDYTRAKLSDAADTVLSLPYTITDDQSETDFTINAFYQTDIGILLDVTIANNSRNERLLYTPFHKFELHINDQKINYISDSRDNTSSMSSYYGLGKNSFQVLFEPTKEHSLQNAVLKIVLPTARKSLLQMQMDYTSNKNQESEKQYDQTERYSYIKIGTIPNQFTITSKMELLTLLKAKYSEAETEQGITTFNITIDTFKTFGEDYAIGLKYDPLFWNQQLTNNTKDALQQHMYKLANEAIQRMPNKRLSGSYEHMWYRYPNLRVGMEVRNYYSWNNYNLGYPLEVNPEHIDGSFRWMPIMDDTLK